MTAISINAIGFCAHFSNQGDWAFNYALHLSENNSLRLNVFYFLKDPYSPDTKELPPLSPGERSDLIVRQEKELRLYYDEKAGDYVNIGFRLCEENEHTELHRCLCKREFQVLIMGCPSAEAVFSGLPIKKFAHHFICPVVLIGPGSAKEIYLNKPAAIIADKLNLRGGDYQIIENKS